jgi:hypothetical protein
MVDPVGLAPLRKTFVLRRFVVIIIRPFDQSLFVDLIAVGHALLRKRISHIVITNIPIGKILAIMGKKNSWIAFRRLANLVLAPTSATLEKFQEWLTSRGLERQSDEVRWINGEKYYALAFRSLMR